MAVFQTYRSDGPLQFDAGMMTMALLGKGTVYTQSKLSGNTASSSVLVPLPDLTTPIIIATQSTFTAARAGRYMNGAQPVAHFVTGAAIGQPMNYWLYGQSNRFPPTNVGLELFDTAGNLTYSSSRPIATIAMILQNLQVIDLPAGRTYAVATQEYSGHARNNGQLYRDGKVYEPGDGTGAATYNWTYRNDGKLYGGFVSGARVGTGEVSNDDVQRQIANQRFPPAIPANSKWERPLGTSLILDVTGH